MRDKLNGIPLLKEYIESVENSGSVSIKNEHKTPFFNTSRITNLGIFRYYAEAYLRQHPMIDANQNVILRHRAPEGNGLPLQVLACTINYQLTPYENLQSEIFEHLLAIMNEFRLKVFQQPTGDDLLALSKIN